MASIAAASAGTAVASTTNTIDNKNNNNNDTNKSSATHGTTKATGATAPSSSSLPCKKRKASNASYTSNNSSSCHNSATAETSASASVHAPPMSEKVQNERRLPSKKRKGSHDQSVQEQQQQRSRSNTRGSNETDPLSSSSLRKGSGELSIFGDDFRIRKGSQDDSIGGMMMLDTTVTEGGVQGVPAPPPPPRKTSHADSLDLESLGNPPELLPTATAVTAADANATSALDHLDALQDERKPAAVEDAVGSAASHSGVAGADSSRSRKPSEDQSNGSSSAAGRKLLFEAIMNTSQQSGTATTQGSAPKIENLPHPTPVTSNSSSNKQASQPHHTNEVQFQVGQPTHSSSRARLDSFNVHQHTAAHSNNNNTMTRDRLDSCCSNNGFIGRRERLESWGGMSDLSVAAPTGDVVTQALTKLSQGHFTEDPDESSHQHQAHAAHAAHLSAAVAGDGGKPEDILIHRDRLGSIASLGEFSASNLPLIVDGIDVSNDDIQAFVAAAMTSVGDQLEDLAGMVENVARRAAGSTDEQFRQELGLGDVDNNSQSSMSTTASSCLLIGAMSDSRQHRPRSWSNASGGISVDLDAVQAAVEATEGLPGNMGLSSMAPPPQKPRGRRQLPLRRRRAGSHSNSLSSSSDQDGQTMRAPARKAAASKPLKKRIKRNSYAPPTLASASAMKTPKVSNRSLASTAKDADVPVLPPVVSSSTAGSKPTSKTTGSNSKGANEKWESFLNCLVDYGTEKRAQAGGWDGHVPTNFKTKDGKALGRWVNNQRSAKTKGTLKEGREQRLIDAGLKWSVLPSNSWSTMFEELEIYVKDIVKQGKSWDGNVPTGYQIKTKASDTGINKGPAEDKNLGRWVNRQRSLYQANKLLEERQVALEKLGLRWSMLAKTTSWETMYEALKVYVALQTKGGSSWDGNVPSTYKTNDTPAKTLGRWVNRQRSAYAKKLLKKEQEEKLTSIGLKWSVHVRQDEQAGPSPPNGNASIAVPEPVPSENLSIKQESTEKVGVPVEEQAIKAV